MSKTKLQYICQSCGASFPKWSGKCESCNEWNTLQEEIVEKAKAKEKGHALGCTWLPDTLITDSFRINTNMSELDRVLGGGLVPGSAILIGGDPGIGKSTILLQLTAALANKDLPSLYISGEESLNQIGLRAKRLGLSNAKIQLLAATHLRDIVTTIESQPDLQFVVVDSIQTMMSDLYTAAPGTVSQVRACAQELITLAKKRNIILVLVGHVTKDGQIAGPKVLEHMVDTVLYFEGDRGMSFRILRAVKNRFGGVHEMGVFEMHQSGLEQVSNPSAMFLPQDGMQVSGSAIFAGVEGTRPLLVEIQALVSPSFMAAPRRAVVGWDSQRLAMIVAVLATRYGIQLMDKEIYLNVAGGLRIQEPAADLAVAAALLSAAHQKPLPHAVYFGEIGLGGEVRSVSQTDIRLNEAEKLGFEEAVLPRSSKVTSKTLKPHPIRHVTDLKKYFETVGA